MTAQLVGVSRIVMDLYTPCLTYRAKVATLSSYDTIIVVSTHA